MLMFCVQRFCLRNGLAPVQVRTTSEIHSFIRLFGLRRRAGAVSPFSVGQRLRREQSARHQRCRRQAEGDSARGCRRSRREDKGAWGGKSGGERPYMTLSPCCALALGAAGTFISAARSKLKGKGWRKIKRGMIYHPWEGGHLNSLLLVMSDHAK